MKRNIWMLVGLSVVLVMILIFAKSVSKRLSKTLTGSVTLGEVSEAERKAVLRALKKPPAERLSRLLSLARRKNALARAELEWGLKKGKYLGAARRPVLKKTLALLLAGSDSQLRSLAAGVELALRGVKEEKGALDKLKPLLQSAEMSVRRQGVMKAGFLALRGLGREVAWIQLQKALKDASPRVRLMAAQALALAGFKKALPSILSQLKTERELVAVKGYADALIRLAQDFPTLRPTLLSQLALLGQGKDKKSEILTNVMRLLARQAPKR